MGKRNPQRIGRRDERKAGVRRRAGERKGKREGGGRNSRLWESEEVSGVEGPSHYSASS